MTSLIDSIEDLPTRRTPYRKLKAYASTRDAREASEFFQTFAKAQNEGTNTAGGFLVPEVVASAIIAYRDRVGVVRANANVVQMTSDQMHLPRRSTGVAGAFVSEAATLADTQTAAFDRVSLSAKKIMALVRASTELEEDAVGFAVLIS